VSVIGGICPQRGSSMTKSSSPNPAYEFVYRGNNGFNRGLSVFRFRFTLVEPYTKRSKEGMFFSKTCFVGTVIPMQTKNAEPWHRNRRARGRPDVTLLSTLAARPRDQGQIVVRYVHEGVRRGSDRFPYLRIPGKFGIEDERGLEE